jgi:glycosyltransferase involved in cell wall biosynthesis
MRLAGKVMKLLILDQTAQRPEDRTFYRALALALGEPVTLITPTTWPREWGMVAAVPDDVPLLRVLPERVVFTGRQHRVLYPSLGKILRTIQPDILFVNAEPEDWVTWQVIRSIARHSPATFPVFMSWRNIPFVGEGIPYKLPRLHIASERAVLASRSHCVARNADAVRLFADLGYHHATYIPPAIDTGLFRPDDRPARLDSDLLHVGFVGRIHAQKGIADLIDAMAGVDGADLTLVGDGPAASEFQLRAKRGGVENRLRWVPAVPQEQLPDILRSFDLLVLPSRTGRSWKEQFGRVLAEAMSCGIPVIGSSSGEIPRVVGDAGLTFPEGNSMALRDAIAHMRKNPAMMREWGTIGRERVLAEFAIPVVVGQYRTLFEKLLR